MAPKKDILTQNGPKGLYNNAKRRIPRCFTNKTESKNAKNKRENLCTVSRFHKQNERIVISLVYNNELEIDDQGRIWRSKVRKGNKCGGVGFYPVKKRRAEHKIPKGYLQIRAMIDGKRYHALAHRLVWHYFFGHIPFGITINHKNGIKDDNKPKNLELLTLSENMKHAHRNGLIDQFGQKNPRAKLSDREVAEIRLIYSEGDIPKKNWHFNMESHSKPYRTL